MQPTGPSSPQTHRIVRPRWASLCEGPYSGHLFALRRKRLAEAHRSLPLLPMRIAATAPSKVEAWVVCVYHGVETTNQGWYWSSTLVFPAVGGRPVGMGTGNFFEGAGGLEASAPNLPVMTWPREMGAAAGQERRSLRVPKGYHADDPELVSAIGDRAIPEFTELSSKEVRRRLRGICDQVLENCHTFSEYIEGLEAFGVTVTPSVQEQGTRLTGIAYRMDGLIMPGRVVGHPYGVVGLAERGVTYVVERDWDTMLRCLEPARRRHVETLYRTRHENHSHGKPTE